MVVGEAGAAARAEALLRLAGWTSVDGPPPAPWWLGGQGLTFSRTVTDSRTLTDRRAPGDRRGTDTAACHQLGNASEHL